MAELRAIGFARADLNTKQAPSLMNGREQGGSGLLAPGASLSVLHGVLTVRIPLGCIHQSIKCPSANVNVNVNQFTW